MDKAAMRKAYADERESLTAEPDSIERTEDLMLLDDIIGAIDGKGFPVDHVWNLFPRGTPERKRLRKGYYKG